MPAARDIKSITYLKTETARVVREVAANRRPLIITQNGTAKVVVMDAATYDEWCDTLALLKLLTLRAAEARAGHVVPQDVVFARIEAQLDEMEAKAGKADRAEATSQSHARNRRKVRTARA